MTDEFESEYIKLFISFKNHCRRLEMTRLTAMQGVELLEKYDEDTSKSFLMRCFGDEISYTQLYKLSVYSKLIYAIVYDDVYYNRVESAVYTALLYFLITSSVDDMIKHRLFELIASLENEVKTTELKEVKMIKEVFGRICDEISMV